MSDAKPDQTLSLGRRVLLGVLVALWLGYFSLPFLSECCPSALRAVLGR